jgi:N-dimethylarginine dimethylaminohydrolase
MQWKLIQNATELTSNFISNLMPMEIASRVLMVTPTYFDVVDAINPHMLDPKTGAPNRVHKEQAQNQWNALKLAYQNLGASLKTTEGKPGLVDMVFCANQTLPFKTQKGCNAVLLSNMENDVRHKEVEFIASFFQSEGYQLCRPPDRTPETKFEGMGDILWWPGKRLLLGGFGPRTRKSSYHFISEIVESDVVLLELIHPKFYHLDTCLAILNSQAALACRTAFTEEGWKILNTLFPQLIEVDLDEADAPYFACNAHCPDQKHVLLQKGSLKVEASLRKAGFVPVPLDTSEFIKSGGSVFCMKMMYF